MFSRYRSQTFTGVLMALLAVLLWSFNFIIARGVSSMIPPISFAFYRWTFALLLLIPIALKKFLANKDQLLKAWKTVLLAGIAGTTLYSPLIYIAGHYSPAINLALIGTTASPVFTLIMAAIFLKEKISTARFIGLTICIAGIIILLSKGSWEVVKEFQFTTGDKWMLLAAFCFAVYNISVRKKPAVISPIAFLFATFFAGVVCMFPGYLWELSYAEPVKWNINIILIILYSGAGTSVGAFFCWNAAINRLGSARTSLFTNLIPVLASLEAFWLLSERISLIQVVSMCIVTAGLALATTRK